MAARSSVEDRFLKPLAPRLWHCGISDERTEFDKIPILNKTNRNDSDIYLIPGTYVRIICIHISKLSRTDVSAHKTRESA